MIILGTKMGFLPQSWLFGVYMYGGITQKYFQKSNYFNQIAAYPILMA